MGSLEAMPASFSDGVLLAMVGFTLFGREWKGPSPDLMKLLEKVAR